MTDREEFEAWLRTPCPDDYKCDPKWAAYIWQAATAAALERAAVACESLGMTTSGIYERNHECASAIRALKDADKC